jgi:hypothetical protein
LFKIVGSLALIIMIAADASLAPEAMPTGGLAAPNAALKGDRLDIGLRGASCAWPRDEGVCVHDGTTPAAAGVRRVHVIRTDRFAAPDEQPASGLEPHRSRQDRSRCASLPPSCGSSGRSVRAMI